MEPVATWIISEVTNRLSTSLGFCSEENTSLALSISFPGDRHKIFAD